LPNTPEEMKKVYFDAAKKAVKDGDSDLGARMLAAIVGPRIEIDKDTGKTVSFPDRGNVNVKEAAKLYIEAQRKGYAPGS